MLLCRTEVLDLENNVSVLCGLGRVFKMHWQHLLAKTDERFVVPRSRISLQYASSSRLALAHFGLRIWTKPF